MTAKDDDRGPRKGVSTGPSATAGDETMAQTGPGIPDEGPVDPKPAVEAEKVDLDAVFPDDAPKKGDGGRPEAGDRSD
jgi:hypothetical protein